MIKLIDQTVKFVNRMRWRAHFFELQNFTTSSPHIDVYDELAGIYNSKRSAPEIKKLKPFDEEQFVQFNQLMKIFKENKFLGDDLKSDWENFFNLNFPDKSDLI